MKNVLWSGRCRYHLTLEMTALYECEMELQQLDVNRERSLTTGHAHCRQRQA